MKTKKTMKTMIAGLFLAMFIMSLSFGNVQAQQGGLAVGLKAGTTGFGADLVTSLGKKFNARAGGSFYSYAMDGTADGGEINIAYDVSMDMMSIPVLIDFYPSNRGFKITAGVHYHDFSINGNAGPTDSYTIEDKTFSPEKMGSLSGNMAYSSKLVPYMGLGFGNALAKGSRMKLFVDMGAMYTNSPEFTMEGTGMIAPTADQAPNFQEGLTDFKFFPVFNLGLSFRIL